MTRRALPLALVLAALACSDVGGSSDDEGGEGGEVALPDEDATLRCPASGEAPPLASLGPIAGDAVLGPCGHAAYHDNQGAGWLVDPSGAREPLDHDVWRVAFAPSGDLLAFERDASELVIRDLLGGSERVVASGSSTDAYGFVPSFVAPEPRGAWLWSCEQGELVRHDASASELVASEVVCGSVVGSSGSPRLAFADVEGRVHRVDLDGGAVLASDDLEWVGHEGSKRDDSLWIDHDGELIVHAAIEWMGDPDADAEWPIDLWARVIDGEGEILLERASGIAARQAARRGAPLFILDDGTIVRFDAGAPSSVDVELDAAELADSGELFVESSTGTLVVLERDELEPLSLAQFDTPIGMQPSSHAEALALAHQTDICIPDALGECERILIALRSWQRELEPSEPLLHSASPVQLEATLDEGSMLVIAAPVTVDGPTYTGEVPPPSLLWLAASGAVLAERSAPNGDLAIRQAFVLPEGRVLAEFQAESGQGELLLARADTSGFESLAPEQDVALLRAWVAPQAERVAFVSESDGGTELWFGALP
jgi:hypothetical protein